MTEHIKIENKQNILTLTFARSDKKNALTNVMYAALADTIAAAETDRAVRAIVIRGEGDMFTAGNDIGEFAAIASGAFKGERHVERFLLALVRSTRPLVAAVQGRAVGIGTTMLLHCDFVLLAENTQLSTPFVNLALVPEAASSLLMRPRLRDVRTGRDDGCDDRAKPRDCQQGGTAPAAARRGRGDCPTPGEAAGRFARRHQAADAQRRRADSANRRRKRVLRRAADDG